MSSIFFALTGATADEGVLHHGACGTALEARWWCPNCETTVDDAAEDGDVIHV